MGEAAVMQSQEQGWEQSRNNRRWLKHWEVKSWEHCWGDGSTCAQCQEQFRWQQCEVECWGSSSVCGVATTALGGSVALLLRGVVALVHSARNNVGGSSVR